MKKLIFGFPVKNLIYVFAFIILAVFLFKLRLFEKIKGLMDNVKRNNSEVPADELPLNTNTSNNKPANINLSDIALQIKNAFTNFGFMVAFGMFTDGVKVVDLINTVPKAYIKDLANIYTINHNRNLYNDCLEGLTHSEYQSIKSKLV